MSGFSLPGLGVYGDDQGPQGLGEDYWGDVQDADLLRMYEEIDEDAAAAALEAQNKSLVAAELRSRMRGDARKAARAAAKAQKELDNAVDAELIEELTARQEHLDEIAAKLAAEQQRFVAERQAARGQAADDAMLAELMAGGDNVVPIQTEAHAVVGADGTTVQNYITDNTGVEHVPLIPDDDPIYQIGTVDENPSQGDWDRRPRTRS